MAKKNASGFDDKWLKGLQFTEQRTEKFKDEDGRPFEKLVPFKRALTQDDLLDWKDYGDSVVLVTADGKKHTVSKKAE